MEHPDYIPEETSFDPLEPRPKESEGYPADKIQYDPNTVVLVAKAPGGVNQGCCAFDTREWCGYEVIDTFSQTSGGNFAATSVAGAKHSLGVDNKQVVCEFMHSGPLEETPSTLGGVFQLLCQECRECARMALQERRVEERATKPNE